MKHIDRRKCQFEQLTKFIGIGSVFMKDAVVVRAYQTDKLSDLKSKMIHFSGPLKDAIDFVEKAQLLDADLWKRFVHQFEETPDDDHGWRGEFWGKVMRGGSLVYTCTGDRALYEQLRASVVSLLAAQDEDGRFSTYSKTEEFHGWDMWSRKYVLLGMEYFLDVCEDTQLRQRIICAMMRHADYILTKVGTGAGQIPINETTEHWGGLNSSSILEPFVRLYNLTGEIRYLEFADYIVSQGGCTDMNIFELAYEGRLYPYQYTHTKAYEMMSCFEGLLEYYRVTGIEKWRVAVENFARLIAASDITIIGCAGCTHELFDHSAVRQLDINEKGVIQETCVSVTWMKLCYQLLRLTGDPFYADHMEKALYNCVLGSVNTEKVTRALNLILDLDVDTAAYTNGFGFPFDSYSPILPGIRGRSVGGMQPLSGGGYYGCCAAIGAAGLGVFGLSTVMKRQNGVAVNQYLNGSFSLEDGKTLEIATGYPVDGRICLTLHSLEDAEFSLYLRIPAWCDRAEATVNGESVSRVFPGSYLCVNRAWHDGDVVCLNLDMTITRIIPEEYGVSSAEASYIAFRRGPLVLCRDARLGQDVDEPITLAEQDTFQPDDQVPFAHLTAWKLETKQGKVRLIDYASAGKTWTEESRIAAWIPVNR